MVGRTAAVASGHRELPPATILQQGHVEHGALAEADEQLRVGSCSVEVESVRDAVRALSAPGGDDRPYPWVANGGIEVVETVFVPAASNPRCRTRALRPRRSGRVTPSSHWCAQPWPARVCSQATRGGQCRPGATALAAAPPPPLPLLDIMASILAAATTPVRTLDARATLAVSGRRRSRQRLQGGVRRVAGPKAGGGVVV